MESGRGRRRRGASLCREASRNSAGSIRSFRTDRVGRLGPPARGWFQAPTVARWWRWSLVRLWVAIKTAIRCARPSGRGGRAGDDAVVLGVSEHRLDHLYSFSVDQLPVVGQDGSHRA